MVLSLLPLCWADYHFRVTLRADECQCAASAGDAEMQLRNCILCAHSLSQLWCKQCFPFIRTLFEGFVCKRWEWRVCKVSVRCAGARVSLSAVLLLIVRFVYIECVVCSVFFALLCVCMAVVGVLLSLYLIAVWLSCSLCAPPSPSPYFLFPCATACVSRSHTSAVCAVHVFLLQSPSTCRFLAYRVLQFFARAVCVEMCVCLSHSSVCAE